MLVLTRQEGERVRLRVKTETGSVDIWVTLLATWRGKARIGFEADKDDVEIVREELADAADYLAWRNGVGGNMIVTPDPHPAAAKR